MHISGEEIRQEAEKREQTCSSGMKGSFYYGFREGAKWGIKEQKAIDDKRIAELESFVERATKLIEAEKAFREHFEAKEDALVALNEELCVTIDEYKEHHGRSLVQLAAKILDGLGAGLPSCIYESMEKKTLEEIAEIVVNRIKNNIKEG